MAGIITVGAAQRGPIARDEPRSSAVAHAHARGCGLMVFPELAPTTFFPRWYFEDQAGNRCSIRNGKSRVTSTTLSLPRKRESRRLHGFPLSRE